MFFFSFVIVKEVSVIGGNLRSLSEKETSVRYLVVIEMTFLRPLLSFISSAI